MQGAKKESNLYQCISQLQPKNQIGVLAMQLCWKILYSSNNWKRTTVENSTPYVLMLLLPYHKITLYCSTSSVTHHQRHRFSQLNFLLKWKEIVQMWIKRKRETVICRSVRMASEPDWERARRWLLNEKVTRSSAKVKGEAAHGSWRGPKLKKTPIFFVDAKRSQIAQEFQKHKS